MRFSQVRITPDPLKTKEYFRTVATPVFTFVTSLRIINGRIHARQSNAPCQSAEDKKR